MDYKFVIPLICLAFATPARAEGYRWHTSTPGKTIELGVPETDDRIMRIDCEAGGKVAIAALAIGEPKEGDPVSVTVKGLGGAEVLKGRAVEYGNGMNFSVLAEPASIAIVTLLTDQPIDVRMNGQGGSISGKGAGTPLKALLTSCISNAGTPQRKARK